MSTETAALADAFRLVNVGVGLGAFVGIFFGWVAHDFCGWVARLAERRASRIDPRDLL